MPSLLAYITSLGVWQIGTIITGGVADCYYYYWGCGRLALSLLGVWQIGTIITGGVADWHYHFLLLLLGVWQIASISSYYIYYRDVSFSITSCYHYWGCGKLVLSLPIITGGVSDWYYHFLSLLGVCQIGTITSYHYWGCGRLVLSLPIITGGVPDWYYHFLSLLGVWQIGTITSYHYWGCGRLVLSLPTIITGGVADCFYPSLLGVCHCFHHFLLSLY